MGLILKQIFGLIKLLNSETGTNQIACGITVGFIWGMAPMLSLQSFILFLILFIFRVQIGAAFITSFFTAFVAYLFDPLFHLVGSSILEAPSLHSIFTWMYNKPLLPYTKFNNSVVMGAAFVSLLLSPVLFFLARKFIQKYREVIVAKFKATKFWKALKATALYKWYYKYETLYGSHGS